MDEIKLTKWRERFEENAKQLQIEYDSFFANYPLEKAFTVKLDESNEWELIIQENIPHDIKSRLQEILWASKPEDSI